MNELNNKIQEILWSYGYPFDEKIKRDNYNQKIYRKRKDKATQAIQALITEQVRLGRIDEGKQFQRMLRGGKLPNVASIWDNRIRELEGQLKSGTTKETK